MDRSSDRDSDKKDWGWLGLLGLLGLGGLMRRRDERHYEARTTSTGKGI
jgi:MYXO-CTERM domain-containing protein